MASLSFSAAASPIASESVMDGGGVEVLPLNQRISRSKGLEDHNVTT